MNVVSHQNDYEEFFFRCDCGDLHVASLTYFGDDDYLDLTVSLHVQHPWYRRWWVALKYAAGIRDRFAYTEMVVNNEDAKALRDFLNKFLGDE